MIIYASYFSISHLLNFNNSDNNHHKTLIIIYNEYPMNFRYPKNNLD